MIKNLSDVTGFTYQIDSDCHHNIFGSEVESPLYGVRTSDEIRRVVLDTEAPLPSIVYWMMRDLSLKNAPNRKQTHDLRFDISYFVPAMFGREYLKTSGHYHPSPAEGQPAWPEVYGVLSGKAIYLLQKVNSLSAGPDEVVVEDCIIVEGNPGDKVIMPPDYGHVTINPLPEPLVMANWVSNRFSSQYGSVEQARGFAYYYIESEGGPRWVKNPAYRDIPPLREARVREVPDLGLTRDTALFTSGQQHPELMDWLNNPADRLDAIWSGLDIIGERKTYEL
jgi:glucose-6-phosphate isomerase